MNIPGDLKYSKNHEWIKIEGNIGIVGITEHAQQELGDIVFVDVETETIGEKLHQEDVFGTIEAVKTAADLFMPLTGEVSEFNDALEDAPETVNNDPYGNGWLIKISIENPDEINELLSAEEYKKLIGE